MIQTVSQNSDSNQTTNHKEQCCLPVLSSWMSQMFWMNQMSQWFKQWVKTVIKIKQPTIKSEAAYQYLAPEWVRRFEWIRWVSDSNSESKQWFKSNNPTIKSEAAYRYLAPEWVRRFERIRWVSDSNSESNSDSNQTTNHKERSCLRYLAPEWVRRFERIRWVSDSNSESKQWFKSNNQP